MKEFEELNEADLLKAYEIINSKITQIERSDKFLEKEYESLLQKRIFLNQKLNKVDEVILDAVRREKYPSREEYRLHNNVNVILEQKNLFLKNSETVVSTIHAEKHFFYSERGSSSDFLKRLGILFTREQLDNVSDRKAGDFITLKHPKLSTPLSHHILYYNDEKKLNLEILKMGIIHVLNDIEKRKLSNISFFGLGFYYVLTADESDRASIASQIANEVAETIVTYFADKTSSSVKSIYFGFVNNKTMNTFDKAFFKWSSLAKQEIYIQKELSRVQKNIITKNNTNDEKFKEILQQISYSINDKSSIVLLGETGVGKSYIAKLLHENSNRSTKPFQTQNCAMLMSERAEAALFGHVKGSYTGATSNGTGIIKEADGGFLFLDEIGTLDLKVQKMLLTFLDSGYFYRLGDYTNKIHSNVKIIFGTNSDLEDLVATHHFAHDLYERIHQRVFNIPALRNRREDIKIIVELFLETLNIINEYPMRIEKRGMEKLSSFNWYGNIRELKFYLERVYNNCKHQKISKITIDIIKKDPPRNKPLLKGDYYQFEKLLKHFMGKWNINNGKFLKEIIEPIAAKVYKDDLKLSATNSSTFLGLTGSKGKISPLTKQYSKYEKAISILKNL